jgi:membrane-bound lytic murein transglycosylase A
MMNFRHLALWLAVLVFTGCQSLEPGIGKAVEFNDLPGWDKDQHAQAFIALDKGCVRLAKKPGWQGICASASKLGEPGDEDAKQFFETHFTPHMLRGEKGTTRGMITGYYEPLLHGAMHADERYRYPLYKTPEDMLIVDLGALYPSLKGKRVRGRVVGNKVLPYYSRAQIESEKMPLSGQELLWVDDRDQLFFLQIQGSGRVQLPDGKIIGAGYANQNGHAYISIGKKLIDMGELKREDVSLFSIKAWLKSNPQRAKALLNENPSYVFFVLRDKPEFGPTGSLNVPLTAERSLAIDPKFVELGAPIWLSTSYPGKTQQPLQKLVMAQDTGGAIKGQLRADLFWGTGEHAENMAGNMKQPGEMFILLPNNKTVAESNSKD